MRLFKNKEKNGLSQWLALPRPVVRDRKRRTALRRRSVGAGNGRRGRPCGTTDGKPPQPTGPGNLPDKCGTNMVSDSTVGDATKNFRPESRPEPAGDFRVSETILPKENRRMIWEFVGRLLLAGVLGAAIGLDREYRAKEAGFRTHFLVSLGSALFMIVSQYGFTEAVGLSGGSFDASRVAAQVVSGIGFLGAGTIIFQKQFVRGLTTAAGLWATAGIGLAVGGGMYALGVAAAVLTLVGLELLTLLFRSAGLRSSMFVFSTTDRDDLRRVTEFLGRKAYKIVSYTTRAREDGGHTVFEVSMVVKTRRRRDENDLFVFLQSLPQATLTEME